MSEFIDKVKVMRIIASGKDDKAYFGSTCNDLKVIDFLGEVPIVTEQEIVKPYLDKLKERIDAQIDGGSHANSYDSGWDDALSEVLDMIDKILFEQEKEK